MPTPDFFTCVEPTVYALQPQSDPVPKQIHHRAGIWNFSPSLVSWLKPGTSCALNQSLPSNSPPCLSSLGDWVSAQCAWPGLSLLV